MNYMTIPALRRSLIPFLLLILVVSGCKKEEPETDLRDKFTRSWTASSCVASGYPMSISRQPGTTDRVVITNLINDQSEITGFMVDAATITIPAQTYHSSDSTIEGTMNTSGTQMSFITVKRTVSAWSHTECGGTAF
jgi:hypothetical protein